MPKTINNFSSVLLTNSPHPIIVINADTSIRFINPAFERLTGFTSSEILEVKPPYPWWIDKDQKKTINLFQSAFVSGTKKTELDFKKKNGDVFCVEITSLPIYKNGKLDYYLANWIDITKRKKLEDRFLNNHIKLLASERELKRFSQKILAIREEEKKKLSSVLHDEIGCMSVSINSILTNLRYSLENMKYSDALKYICDCKSTHNIFVNKLRNIAVNLRPANLEIIGLSAALEDYFTQLKKSIKINLNFNEDIKVNEISNDVEIVAYRITQEALNNIIKHSQANKIDIKLFTNGNNLILNIFDNGNGFDIDKVRKKGNSGMGIRGMIEMAESLLGTFTIHAAPGKGTRLQATLPIKTSII